MSTRQISTSVQFARLALFMLLNFNSITYKFVYYIIANTKAFLSILQSSYL